MHKLMYLLIIHIGPQFSSGIRGWNIDWKRGMPSIYGRFNSFYTFVIRNMMNQRISGLPEPHQHGDQFFRLETVVVVRFNPLPRLCLYTTRIGKTKVFHHCHVWTWMDANNKSWEIKTQIRSTSSVSVAGQNCFTVFDIGCITRKKLSVKDSQWAPDWWGYPIHTWILYTYTYIVKYMHI